MKGMERGRKGSRKRQRMKERRDTPERLRCPAWVRSNRVIVDFQAKIWPKNGLIAELRKQHSEWLGKARGSILVTSLLLLHPSSDTHSWYV